VKDGESETNKEIRTITLGAYTERCSYFNDFDGNPPTGLFVSPLVMSTGQSIVSISFAFAIGQLVWGAVQPVFGAVADKWGSARVVVFGAVLLAAGMGLTPYVSSEWGLIATMGVISPAGAGAGSFALLFGAIARHIPEERRAFAGGFINAGSSFGQFLFAPLTQALIGTFNWTTAMFSLAAAALFTIPLAAPLRQGAEPHTSEQAHVSGGLFQQVTAALRDRSYLCLHAGFFTCGFHVAFLVTHLPGEVALSGHAATVSAASIGIIGLFNIAGSLCAGALGSRYRMKYILAVMYGSRAIMIGLYLFAPNCAYLLCVCGITGIYLARNSTADCWTCWQALWCSLPVHSVRINAPNSSNRRFFGCMAGGNRDG
jgi:MFS family permease